MVKMMRHQSCNVTLTLVTAETNSRRGLEGGIKVEEKRKNKENVKLAVEVGALWRWRWRRRRLQDAAEHGGRWFDAGRSGKTTCSTLAPGEKVLIVHAGLAGVRPAKYGLYWTWKFDNQSVCVRRVAEGLRIVSGSVYPGTTSSTSLLIPL